MTKAVDDDRILREAARLFRRHGYAATTVRQIAKASRMLPGSLHYRYPTKDDMLTALLDRGAEALLAELDAEISKSDDALERLRLAFGRYLELLLEGDDALFVLLFDWRAIPPGATKEADAARARIEEWWDVRLAEAWATGRARKILDLQLLRNLGVGAANWTATWYKKEDGRSPRDIADLFWAYLSFGLIDEKQRPKDFAKFFERKQP